jgi:pyruvate dehydrogenase E1 component alpha subunit
MAALYEAPIVIIVENNQFAYSTPLDQEMRAVNIVSKAAAHGVDGLRVDGNDVEAVYQAAVRGITLAREGAGPYLIQADTMRMLGHAIHDGAEYVPEELLEKWERLDPLTIHRRRLTSYNVTTDSALDRIDQAAKERVTKAIAEAEAAPLPDPGTLNEGVYA